MIGKMMLNDGNKYAHIWEKYRPVILSLMVASAKEPQTYKLSNHEFLDLSPRKTSGYAFQMRIHQNKSLTDIKKSILAQDLLYVLKHSEKAFELSSSFVYEFELDKQFNLHIRRELDTPEETE